MQIKDTEIPYELDTDALRVYLDNIMESIRHNPIHLQVTNHVICSIVDHLNSWQKNDEFFWEYLEDMDGIGGWKPNPIEIPIDISLIVFVRISFDHDAVKNFYNPYMREKDTYTFNGTNWINDITKEELSTNKKVVAFGYLPNCKVKYD